jgi:hypothetical protein
MTADNAGKLLPPRKRAIFDYIVAHPCCDRAQITGYVYDAPRGSDANLISVHINGINKVIMPNGWRVVSVNRHYHGATYRAVQS